MFKSPSFKEIKEYLILRSINSSEDIIIPLNAFDMVIGQEHAVKVMKFAIQNKRHVLLIGPPGCGKSMLAKAVSKILPPPSQKLLIRPNPLDPESPIAFFVSKDVNLAALKKRYTKIVDPNTQFNYFTLIPLAMLTFYAIYSLAARFYNITVSKETRKIALYLLSTATNLAFNISYLRLFFRQKPKHVYLTKNPKIIELLQSEVLSDMSSNFINATSGGWSNKFGTVMHDPYKGQDKQTGDSTIGKFIIPGAVHKSHEGILYIDEIGTLTQSEQYTLLTIVEDKKYPISGKSDQSSGGSNAHVTTNPVDCDFRLVLAGNYETVKIIHPALRSRIRGYGYEVYMNETIDVNESNYKQILQFIAQEVRNQKLLKLNQDTIVYLTQLIILESGITNKFTLKLRDFSGYILAGSDIAKSKLKSVVELIDIREGIENKLSLETQKFLINDANKQARYGSVIGSINTYVRAKTLSEFSNYVSSEYRNIQLHYNISVSIIPLRYDPITFLLPFNEKDPEFLAFKNNLLSIYNLHFSEDTLSISSNCMHTELLPKYSELSLAVLVAAYSAKLKIAVPDSYLIIGAVDNQGFVRPISDLQFKLQDLQSETSFISNIICSDKEKITTNIKINYISHITDIPKLKCFTTRTGNINYFE